MDYRERQQSQFVRVSGLQKLTQKFKLLFTTGKGRRSFAFPTKPHENIRELCSCAIIYKLRIEYYPVTLKD